MISPNALNHTLNDMIWLILIVLIGLFFWLANLHIIQLSRDWPLILILIGIANILNASRRNKRRAIISKLESGKINVDEAEKELIKSRSK